MRQVIDNLNETHILKHQTIISLKEYINQKFADASQQKKAAAFADAVHRIVDSYIQEFDETYRKMIRLTMLQQAATNNSFDLYASDIFQTCLELQTKNNSINDENYIQSLTLWVNKQQNFSVSKDSLTKLICYLNDNAVDLKEHRLEQVIEAFQKTPEKPAVPFNLKQNLFKIFSSVKPIRIAIIAPILILCLSFYVLTDEFSIAKTKVTESSPEAANSFLNQKQNELPDYLKYKPINKLRLKTYLENKNSLLVEEPYFSTILQVAKDYNINPLLMFAITGQEQGYVPKTNKYAKTIVNNPFNVYHSWKKFNTGINDSAEIAAKTIINLSKDRPATIDAIQWINRKYAEDSNWWQGVRTLFYELEREAGMGDLI